MKKIRAIFTILIMVILATTQSYSQEKEQKIKESTHKVEIKVTGMTCAGCASHVSQVISDTDGVIEQEVKYPGNIAVVTYNPTKTSPKDLIATIEENTTYKAEVKKKDSKNN